MLDLWIIKSPLTEIIQIKKSLSAISFEASVLNARILMYCKTWWNFCVNYKLKQHVSSNASKFPCIWYINCCVSTNFPLWNPESSVDYMAWLGVCYNEFFIIRIMHLIIMIITIITIYKCQLDTITCLLKLTFITVYTTKICNKNRKSSVIYAPLIIASRLNYVD